MVQELGWFDVVDVATAGEARCAAARAGERCGLDDVRVRELASAVAELGNNLHEHAGGGRIAVRALHRSGLRGIEIVAVDTGPGMPGFPGCSRAECSAEQLRGGLGAAVRLASRHDGYSLPGRGTVVTIQFWPRGVYPAAFVATGLTRPMLGEQISGDRFGMVLRDDGPILLVADGLGHGPLAEEASRSAAEAFYSATTDSPAELVEAIHHTIAHTRGAAVAIARLEPSVGVVRFAGLGNIAAAVVGTPDGAGARRTGMVSQPGVAGHQRGTVHESCYPLGPGDLVILHSDGVVDRWDLAAYPGLAHHDPLVVAATLLRDAGVRRDDACVLVARSY
ncbi:MAG: SpoIIE family protein phosphatase [Dactylosporangium sp.]|nr:SpoIIE family protein phosphatase [Dactylosporangium sp.]NNJ60065.1 SpoIIE family protein phosphatase [Dactylosporangium sp.]